MKETPKKRKNGAKKKNLKDLKAEELKFVSGGVILWKPVAKPY